MEQIKTLISIDIWRFPSDDIRIPIYERVDKIDNFDSHVRSTIWTVEIQRIHWQTDTTIKYSSE